MLIFLFITSDAHALQCYCIVCRMKCMSYVGQVKEPDYMLWNLLLWRMHKLWIKIELSLLSYVTHVYPLTCSTVVCKCLQQFIFCGCIKYGSRSNICITLRF